MAARRQRHTHEEEHENHERWLITYADMITLLMVLFIVLFSIGQTDLKKFEQLKAGLSKSFGGRDVAIAGGGGLLDAAPAPNLEAVALEALREKEQQQEAAQHEHDELVQTRNRLEAALDANGLGATVQFRLEPRGLVVAVVTDRVLFDLGSAALRPEGRAVLGELAPVLASLPNQLVIEGHTDDRPINGGPFASNWELSTARATSVLRYLVEAHGVAPARLSAAGYADQRPLHPNDSDTHRAQNRRVEIVVVAETHVAKQEA